MIISCVFTYNFVEKYVLNFITKVQNIVIFQPFVATKILFLYSFLVF